MLKRSFLPVFITYFLLLPTMGQAQSQAKPSLSDPFLNLGPQSVARAGSTNSSTVQHDSQFQNPASPAFSKVYAVSLNYLGIANSLSASVVDTKSGPIGGGFYYTRRNTDGVTGVENSYLGDFKRQEQVIGGSLMGRISKRVAIGFNAKYLILDSSDSRVLDAKKWNVDGGLRVMVTRGLSLGALYKNFLGDQDGYTPPYFSFGAEYQIGKSFAFAARLLKINPLSAQSRYSLPGNPKKFAWSVGAQYNIGSSGAQIRAGFFDNPAWDNKWITAGLGFKMTQFTLDYSFQYDSVGKKQLHGFGVSGLF